MFQFLISKGATIPAKDINYENLSILISGEELTAEDLDEDDILQIISCGNNISRNYAIQILRSTNGDVVNAIMNISSFD